MNRRNHSKQKQRAGQDTELKAVLRKHKAEGLKVRRANETVKVLSRASIETMAGFIDESGW